MNSQLFDTITRTTARKSTMFERARTSSHCDDDNDDDDYDYGSYRFRMSECGLFTIKWHIVYIGWYKTWKCLWMEFLSKYISFSYTLHTYTLLCAPLPRCVCIYFLLLFTSGLVYILVCLLLFICVFFAHSRCVFRSLSLSQSLSSLFKIAVINSA